MLIRLQNITKSYGETEPKVTAINKLDLAIDTNEQVAIMGKSGCGKTTLINVLSTIDYPTEGKYYFDDIEVNN
jgi:putative ABC transport system ATP-binding protein